jgi:cytohesin
VWFAEESQRVPAKGFIRLSSAEKDPVPEHPTHFTIARFQDGHYDCLRGKVNLQDELAVPAGHYMLVTANSVNASRTLAGLSFFEVKENEHKAIDITLRRWSRSTTGVGLYRAAWSGDLLNVERSLAEGSDVSKEDEWGWTALHWAVRGKHKEVAEFLIAKGANVNAKAEKGLTPLHLAMTSRQDELAEMLIAKGADVNAKGLTKDGTPLLWAVEHDQKELAGMLLAKGADVNARNNWDWTPLHCAIYGSKDTAEIAAMIELLIARGANVNATDGDNRTPLWYAQKETYTEIVELLRQHGARE